MALGLTAGATTWSHAQDQFGTSDFGSQGDQSLPAEESGVTPIQDDTTWRRRGAWNGGGDFGDTRSSGHSRGWRGDGWRDDWRRRGDWRRFNHDGYGHRRYNRGPTVYFDLDLTPQRYIRPRYHVQPRRAIGVPRAHVAWCYDRYRSYRAWDNSFQPHHGPRRQCYSPYI